ncbi:hypothetical protein ACLB2K_054606 [Fragaria x ananassa]
METVTTNCAERQCAEEAGVALLAAVSAERQRTEEARVAACGGGWSDSVRRRLELCCLLLCVRSGSVRRWVVAVGSPEKKYGCPEKKV